MNAWTRDKQASLTQSEMVVAPEPDVLKKPDRPGPAHRSRCGHGFSSFRM